MSSNSELVSVERELIEKKHELDSIIDRIRDLEWCIEVNGDDEYEARRRAVDKVRYVKNAIKELEIRRAEIVGGR